MQWMKTGFVGYGRFADLWLYGMEEHCLSDEDAASRLTLLPSFPLTIGLAEAHRRYGFAALPPGVAVWTVARDLATACGLSASNVGETDGGILLAELLPLPRRTNDRHQWPAAYKPLFTDYAQYENALLRPRVERLARLIIEHAPRVVVIHGVRYHDAVEAALVASGGVRDPRRFVFSNKPSHIVDLGSSRVVFTHNFGRSAAWSAEARSALSSFVAALWRGDALDRFEMATAESSPEIDSILIGMFHHRGGNVLPRELAAQLPGYMLHASKTSLFPIVRREDFRRWATQPTPLLHGRTPIEACIERDRRDLLHDARYERLHKRYGRGSVTDLQSATESAHARVRAWEAADSER